VNDQERYEHAVRQLAHCDYEGLLDEQGYIVRQLSCWPGPNSDGVASKIKPSQGLPAQ
jgi:hypothetical protein